jgi:ABC-type transport system involved in cytochrome c biogenesis permease subunit
MLPDRSWLVMAMAVYLCAAISAVVTAARGRGSYRLPMLLLAVALAVHSVAIGLRWGRLGHGPYVNLYEILSSNVWSLHLAVLLACLAFRQIRASLAMLLPALQILVLWLLAVAPVDGAAPVTYETIWLAVHVWLGKVFLGCTVVAVGLSLVVLARGGGIRRAFSGMPASMALDELAYRFVLVAFVFESLMLVAGAIWAQDAWGRYWAWDPLETWAFVTWLAVVAYLHLRLTRRPRPVVSALMIMGIFIVAFSTFFGMPFISVAPHKGAI